MSINLCNADTNIVFVDMDKILSMSKPGSSILKQLNVINDKNLKRFEETEKNLKKKEEKLIKQKNILSQEDFRVQLNELKIEVNEYNKNRNAASSKLNELKIVNTKKFLKLVNPILSKYSDVNSISLILQKKNLIIAKSELDVTDEIIILINDQINVFKIQ
jgi:Skp family chaperone for outer membrane proteins